MGEKMGQLAMALWNRGWFRTSRIVYRMGGNGAARWTSRVWSEGLPF